MAAEGLDKGGVVAFGTRYALEGCVAVSIIPRHTITANLLLHDKRVCGDDESFGGIGFAGWTVQTAGGLDFRRISASRTR